MLSLRFVPFVRAGLSGLARRDPSSARAQAQVSVDLVGAGGEELLPGGHTVLVPLLGPGDVVGLDPAAILRTVPAPGEGAYPSNRLASIELSAPDLPWRFSPDAPQRDRLLPWIALLVLPEGAFSVLPPATRGLPARLRVPEGRTALLPDPAQSWAFAHAQLVVEDGAGGPPPPELRCARVMSPLRLREGGRYSAFVVPVFEAGRVAAFNAHPDGVRPADLVPWKVPASGDFDLPIYHRWSFQAGPPDNLEAMLRALGADVDDKTREIGRRTVDGANPGQPLSPAPGPDTFEVGGALLPFGDAGAMADARGKDLAPALRKALTDASLALRPPTYGSALLSAAADQLPTSEALAKDFEGSLRNGWIAALNLRRRNRVAAALGAEVVKRCQESFAAECWRQVGDLPRANEQLRAAQIGAALGSRIHQEHIAPLTEGHALSMAQPFQDVTMVGGRTLAEALEGTALARGGLSFAARKVFSGRVRPAARDDRASFSAFVEARVRPGEAQGTSARSALFGGSSLRPDVVEVDPLPAGVTALLHPTPALRARLRRTVLIDGVGRQGLSEAPAGPRVTAPLYEPLVALGLDLFLPRASLLERNKIAFFRENREAITAFMAGANHEMARELVWREYPLAPGFSALRSFWEPLTGNADGIDLRDLSQWERLGEPAPGVTGERVVIGLRGDVVEQCPDLLIHLLRTGDPPRTGELQKLVTQLDEEEAGSPNILSPAFRARAGADLVFHGFALTEAELLAPKQRFWLVLSQPPSLPTFGAKVRPAGSAALGAVSAEDLSWDHLRLDRAGCLDPVALAPGARLTQGTWDDRNTSATIAACLFRHPIQRVIDVRDLLPKKG